LEEKVNRDPVSDALSRRAGEDALRNAFSRGLDDPANPAIVTFDIDDFKRINDTYGHDVGDRILKRIATIIHSHIRSKDHLFRWGGDEFLLLYGGLKPENIMRVCRNLLDAVSGDVHSFGSRHETVSLSIGISYFRETDTDYSDALKRADIALYRSKANGKNQANIEL
ncbi:MAG: GGDEF domain-containing protein, partial [Synergistaceae bacterium]|nr:GGDEF domain-containing protein [Synergistaceae bacterium]